MNCFICQKEIKHREPSKMIRNKRNFCSRACYVVQWAKDRTGPKNAKWAGGKVDLKCQWCGKTFTTPQYRKKIAKFCSQSCLGKFKFTGEKNPLWKGGITSSRDKIRHSDRYRKWRDRVYRRDYWTCQECNQKGKEIEAHHIRRWSDYPELTFKLWNGITLCKPCHDLTYGKEKMFEERYFRKTLNDYTPGILHKKIKI